MSVQPPLPVPIPRPAGSLYVHSWYNGPNVSICCPGRSISLSLTASEPSSRGLFRASPRPLRRPLSGPRRPLYAGCRWASFEGPRPLGGYPSASPSSVSVPRFRRSAGDLLSSGVVALCAAPSERRRCFPRIGSHPPLPRPPGAACCVRPPGPRFVRAPAGRGLSVHHLRRLLFPTPPAGRGVS